MISKNFTKYFQIPLYWLTLLVFFVLVDANADRIFCLATHKWSR